MFSHKFGLKRRSIQSTRLIELKRRSCSQTKIQTQVKARTAEGRSMDMFKADGLRSVIFCAGLLVLCDSFVSAAEVVTSKAPSSSGSCHLKFPAISEATLFSDHPVLKDPSEGDMIDFYGPCDYDPLGRASILRQRYEYRHRMRKQARD
jgi:hypothetical protein